MMEIIGGCPIPDPTAAEAVEFVPLPDATRKHPRRGVVTDGAQRVFDGEDPFKVLHDVETQLRQKHEPLLDLNPVKGNYVLDRSLRRCMFAARGHTVDRFIVESINERLAQGDSFADGNWPEDPDYYVSTTVDRYAGSMDRFMRAAVGINDQADERAKERLGPRFMTAYNTAYNRYYVSLEAYKAENPHEDQEADPDGEVNWRLGRRGNSDNSASIQIMHAYSYLEQHPNATVDEIFGSALTSATVYGDIARIRKQQFRKLGFKDLGPRFDAWERGRAYDLRGDFIPLYMFDDEGCAHAVHPSLSPVNDNYCSANIDIRHSESKDRHEIERLAGWMAEHSNWRDLDDSQGGRTHELGAYNQTTIQIWLGALIARETIFPSYIEQLQLTPALLVPTKTVAHSTEGGGASIMVQKDELEERDVYH